MASLNRGTGLQTAWGRSHAPQRVAGCWAKEGRLKASSVAAVERSERRAHPAPASLTLGAVGGASQEGVPLGGRDGTGGCPAPQGLSGPAQPEAGLRWGVGPAGCGGLS